MDRLRRGALLVGIVLGAGAQGAFAAIPAPPSEWYSLPGLNAASGATWVRAFAVSSPPTVAYAGTEGGGVFKSTNGGATWSAFNDGLATPAATRVRALLTDGPGTTTYAATEAGVWKSTGGAWTPAGQGSLAGSVESLLALPGDALLAGVTSGGVWRSADGGATWTAPAAGNGMPSGETPRGFAEAGGVVLAATATGVYRSTDGGATWTLIGNGVPAAAAPLQPWIDALAPAQMYVSTAVNGVYRSVNGGVTWAPVNAGLGAVRARGLQIFPGASGVHLYAATENGLWQALDAHAASPPAPRWRAVTQEGLGANTSLWALTGPVIPGTGSVGLLAGSQTGGGYFMGFEPPDSPCPSNHTNNVTANCPRISDTTPTQGQSLSVTTGTWDGTPTIDYAYQWQSCSGTDASDCSDIADAEEPTFVVPATTARYRVKVTATNAAPTFAVTQRTSAITAATVPSGGTLPGDTQSNNPSIGVTPAGHQSAPVVGDSVRAEYGTTPSASSDGWFNPKATEITYQWLRCEAAGSDCNEIPGATARNYVLADGDGTRTLRVRVTGVSSNGRRQLTSPASGTVISAPAAVADPLPDPGGGAARSQAPALVGIAMVGETLAGNVGGWRDPTTEFRRSWLRCDASGAACTPLADTGPSYVVRPEDAGSTLRLRVTADVNGDLSDGPADNAPTAVEVDSAPSAVVATRPVTGGDPPGGGVVAGDTTAPVITGLTMSRRRFAVAAKPTAVAAAKRAPRGTRFRFLLSEAASARLTIARLRPGRKVGRACRKPTRANRKRKRCTRATRAGTLTRASLAAGPVAVRFSGRIGKRKLAPGPYRATAVATDAAGNSSRPARVRFTIVRG